MSDTYLMERDRVKASCPDTMNPPPPPRVLIFPFPVQGHVNPMLHLAELLALSGVHVTFLNSDHAHNRLLTHTCSSRFDAYAGFQFRTIPDGLPEDHPRSPERVRELYETMKATVKPLLREVLVRGGDGSRITCIIADGLFGRLTIEIGDELRIPIIHFRTFSAASFFVYFSIPDIIQAGELPIRGDDDMDRITTVVPGMESFLRCRDLPTFCRVNVDLKLNTTYGEARHVGRARGLILNTFEDLEGPILSHVRGRCNPTIYTVGPLHALLKETLLRRGSTPSCDGRSSNNTLFEVDETCVAWLDSQPPRSVIYVSFGSLAIVTRDKLTEFWHGLVNSKKRFLMVVRSDLLGAGEEIQGWVPRELSEATKERGFVARWVPQEEVLSHPAVGGFLTHSGWNSTLESVVAGVPMICWPTFGDQQVNSRFVGEVWRLGIDMKDVCDRNVVEKMVNDLMTERRDEFARSAAEMARLAKESVSQGGSSCCNLERLISDIKTFANEASSVSN